MTSSNHTNHYTYTRDSKSNFERCKTLNGCAKCALSVMVQISSLIIIKPLLFGTVVRLLATILIIIHTLDVARSYFEKCKMLHGCAKCVSIVLPQIC